MIGQKRFQLKTAGMTYAGLFVCFLVILASFACQRNWLFGNKLRVSFLDVGQGSSTLIRFPSGRVMLVDGGGSRGSDFDIGEMVVAPYLWRKGISRIDQLVATHAHSDHFKGLKFLVDEFRPREFIWNGIEPEDEEELAEWNDLMDVIKKNEVPIFTPGQVRDLDILSPPKVIPSHWTENDMSIVMIIKMDDIDVLLAGDIETAAEEHVVKQLLRRKISRITGHRSLVTVLQVPHHGSGSSSTADFLIAVRPDFAVIQVGENNRYGFPNKEVLKRLEDIGARIYRTDKDGAVEFVIDGQNVEVSTF
jgi:competence protein ComEC